MLHGLVSTAAPQLAPDTPETPRSSWAQPLHGHPSQWQSLAAFPTRTHPPVAAGGVMGLPENRSFWQPSSLPACPASQQSILQTLPYPSACLCLPSPALGLPGQGDLLGCLKDEHHGTNKDFPQVLKTP